MFETVTLKSFLIITPIAIWSVIEIWHHGTIFEKAREVLVKWKDNGNKVSQFIAGAALCPFCLSVWLGMGYTVLANVPILYFAATLPFAACRLANVLNDLTKVKLLVNKSNYFNQTEYLLTANFTPNRGVSSDVSSVEDEWANERAVSPDISPEEEGKES